MTKKKGNGAKDSSSNSIFYLSGKDVQEEARQEALRQEAVTPPAPTDDSNTLCSISGVVAGLSGAALGFVFGFGSKVISHRGAGRFKAARREGWGSAKSFALFGGVYTTASCMIQRLRMKQDPINGGLAGAITGLVLSWGGDPKQMILSVVMMGAFSYMVDRMNAPAAATSAISAAPATTGRRRSRREHDSSRQTWPLVQGPPKRSPRPPS